jgi:hypothetical protein
MVVWRKGSGSKQNEGRKLKASGGGELLVEAVLCGETAQEGEGRGRDRQEAHWREVAWGDQPRNSSGDNGRHVGARGTATGAG